MCVRCKRASAVLRSLYHQRHAPAPSTCTPSVPVLPGKSVLVFTPDPPGHAAIQVYPLHWGAMLSQILATTSDNQTLGPLVQCYYDPTARADFQCLVMIYARGVQVFPYPPARTRHGPLHAVATFTATDLEGFLPSEPTQDATMPSYVPLIERSAFSRNTAVVYLVLRGGILVKLRSRSLPDDGNDGGWSLERALKSWTNALLGKKPHARRWSLEPVCDLRQILDNALQLSVVSLVVGTCGRGIMADEASERDSHNTSPCVAPFENTLQQQHLVARRAH